jgi:hypothetical protein
MTSDGDLLWGCGQKARPSEWENGNGRAGMTGTDRRGQAWGGGCFGLVDGLRVS